MFTIEDDIHAEPLVGTFVTIDDALAELRRLAELPWDEVPNVAPCTNWRACGRHYHIVEYDMTVLPWKELSRIPALDVSAEGSKWRIKQSL